MKWTATMPAPATVPGKPRRAASTQFRQPTTAEASAARHNNNETTRRIRAYLATTMKKTILAILTTLTPLLATAAHHVNLAWNAHPDPRAVAFRVYTGTNGPGLYFATNRFTGTSGTVSNLQSGIVHRFAISAVEADGSESDLSPETLWASDPVAPPVGLRVTSVLQTASSPAGPWRDIMIAGVPLTAIPTNQFFRTKLSIE